jgi:UDP-glucose 4-epimerase
MPHSQQHNSPFSSSKLPAGRAACLGSAVIGFLLFVLWQSSGDSYNDDVNGMAAAGHLNSHQGGGQCPVVAGKSPSADPVTDAACASTPVWFPSKGKRVLVTGAAGFIGSHVAKFCANELGMEVVGVDDMSGGFEYNLDHSSFYFVKGDLQNATFVHELFDEFGPFEYVYHLAAYAAEGLSHFIRSFNYRNNLVASMHVLNEAVNGGTQVFVFTSSIAAYGAGQTPMVETTVPQPEDPYGVSKYAVELDLRAAHEMFGMNYVVFRPHNVYGEGQNVADKYRNVIGIFMRQILSGLPMTIFGDGEQTRAFSYIDDVAPYIAKSPLLASARNQVFNVGADTPYSLNVLAKAVAKAMGVEANVKHLQARNEVVHAHSDHAKLRCHFHPDKKPVPLEEGLARMAAWVQEREKEGSFTPVIFDDIEVQRNMPPSWTPKGARAAGRGLRDSDAEMEAMEKKKEEKMMKKEEEGGEGR